MTSAPFRKIFLVHVLFVEFHAGTSDPKNVTTKKCIGQRRRNDNINKNCVLEGVGGRGKFSGKLSKTLSVLRSSQTIDFGNFANFIVRNFVVISEAPSWRGKNLG